MPAALVVALFAGAAVAVAAGSSSRKSSVLTIRLPKQNHESKIKFEDARYTCTRGQPGWGIYKQGIRQSDLIPYLSGYEYLSDVPASGRVKAMRLKIRSHANPSLVKPFIEASEINMFKIGQDFLEASRTPSGRMALANRLGVPVSSINEGLDSVAKIVSKYTGATMGAYVRELAVYGSDYVSKLIREYAAKIVAEMAGTAAGAAVAEAIPIIGQVLAIYLKAANLAHEMRVASWEDACHSWNDSFKKSLSTLTAYGFPIPWQMFNVLSPKCREPDGGSLAPASTRWTPTADQNIIMNTLNAWFKQFMALPSNDIANVRRWWTLTSTYMSDTRVSDVFSAMCSDSLGGTIASDEQVMIVAAPIAVANGLDVDSFAEALHARAVGWVNLPSKQRMIVTLDRPMYKCGSGILAGGCDINGYEIICKNIAINSFVLNLANLTSTAFPLAEEMKRKRISLAKPLGASEDKSSTYKPVFMSLVSPSDSTIGPTTNPFDRT